MITTQKRRWAIVVLFAASFLAGVVSAVSAGAGERQRLAERRRPCRASSRRARVLRRRIPYGRAAWTPDEAGQRRARPEVIAHRGASADAPENTLASVRLAWQQHADAVEIDVYLSRDEAIVVYHDKTTKRIGGRDRPVRDQTLAELRQLDVGAWKGPEFEGERIPTLDQVLTTVPEGKRLFIEIKAGPEIVPVLVRMLERWSQTSSSAVVIAFSYEVADQIKRALPNVPVYWLVAFERDDETGEWKPSLTDVIARASRAGFDGIDVNDTALLDEHFVRQVHGSGLSLFVWTVNDEARAEELSRLGVDGITTDVPAALLRRLTVRPPSRCKQ